MNSTLNYYNANAAAFFTNTVSVNMNSLHDRFLAQVSAGGLVLDAGCGSGRDAKAFSDRGFRISAFDASAELAALASAHLGAEVAIRTFAEVCEHSCYDGIWACASLLHLPTADIPGALKNLWHALKPGGAFYLSFKIGSGERVHDGRHFTDVTEAELHQWISPLPGLESVEYWTTSDQRPGRSEHWLNAIFKRAAPIAEKLITGGADPFLPYLCGAVNTASEIDIAVAFIKTTGLRLLLPDLHSALQKNRAHATAPARIRILTSDYLDVTDPEALRLLMLLQEQGAQVKVYQAAGGSFHLKAYMFARIDSENGLLGTAFIGSSNISRQALQTGLEWNYRVNYPGDDGYLEARARFEELFADSRCIELTDGWIDQYDARRVPLPRAVAPGSLEHEAPPEPTPVQKSALNALSDTRDEGFRSGLVVLATGLGKTWLAAFDAAQFGARRILFVAHREEILNQAAETFLRIRPKAKVGFYAGQVRDVEVDVLCASVQTLGQATHLERFSPNHFDYIVIDEFHHAAATTYRKVLAYFTPRFLLGLTATPERSDQSDILSLCDDNLVFTCGLIAGVKSELLVPFHYYGIYDDTVNYAEIPWRNGKFDPDQLSNKLATLARAKHALKEWQEHKQERTLAFCISIAHAEFMAAQFDKAGVTCAAVYGGSKMSRGEALEQLRDGKLAVIFSVDLFNEGVDLPSIDTVMMLRPTESKILFLQQLGRGLRKSVGKEKLVILDFIGNHKSFLHKPLALFEIGANHKHLAEFARKAEENRLELPDGCYVSYDLRLIDFLKSLDSEGIVSEYTAMRDALGRRPTLAEFYRAGASMQLMRNNYGSWFEMIAAMGDLDAAEGAMLSKHGPFLREVETTAMTKSFKMVLLEAFQELNGWETGPTTAKLASRSWDVLQRRRSLLADLAPAVQSLTHGTSEAWQRYWTENPIKAWTGGNKAGGKSYFRVLDGQFLAAFTLQQNEVETLTVLVQELVDYRFATYEIRLAAAEIPDNVVPFPSAKKRANDVELPYFPNLKIACGHFKGAKTDAEEYRSLSQRYGHLDPERHFIARAAGNSMNGGKNPIHDGDYLLLEHITPSRAGSITGTVMAIERQDETGEGSEYLLRTVLKSNNGQYLLKANNPDYQDMPATEDMRTLARLRAVVSPLEMALNQSFLREDIPQLFGEAFNPGNWNAGHVTLAEQKAIVLLVTINKQGKILDHRYLDHWIDERTFHWQSQNTTTPESKRGQDVINHAQNGVTLHLFVRETKLSNGKGAPFFYHGKALYKSHTGSAPMSVILELTDE